MNTRASRAMLNGLTSQLTTTGTAISFGLRTMPPIAMKSTFSIIGYIIGIVRWVGRSTLL